MTRHHTERSEWTPARGLARGALSLLVKSPFCLVAWAGFVFVTEPVATWIATHGGTFWILPGTALLAAVVVAILAVPFGQLFAHRLTEHVGFEGPIPAFMGIAVVWAATMLGTRVALIFCGPGTWVTTVLELTMAGEASLVILWRAWIGPD